MVVVISIVVFIFMLVVALALLIWLLTKLGLGGIELPEKRAGRMGERIASTVIWEILRDDDILYTNVGITSEGKQTELDNLIINSKGVFIIEVKNYSGELYGDEEGDEWIKIKMTPGGTFYQKTVKNPIKQVKRQIYILSRLLKSNGINAWINGYIFFVQNNAPFDSPYFLKTQHDIDVAIHGNGGNTLRSEEIERIMEFFYHG